VSKPHVRKESVSKPLDSELLWAVAAESLRQHVLILPKGRNQSGI
jgi:hypothetical protein